MANEKELIMKFKVDTTDLVKTQNALKQTGTTAMSVKQQVEAITGKKYGDFVKGLINSDAAKNIAADRADRTRAAISRATSARSVEDIAYERINAQRQQKEIRAQMEEIDPSLIKKPSLMSQMPRGVKALLGVSAATSAIRGLTNTMKKTDLEGRNAGVLESLMGAGSELPFIGSMFKSAGELTPDARFKNKLSGALGRFEERAAGQNAISSIRRGNVGFGDDLEAQGRAARGEAAGAAAFAADVSKNGAGRFITEDVAGVSSAAQGQAQLALAQAQANASGSSQALKESQAALAAQQARRDAAQKRFDDAARAQSGAIGTANAFRGEIDDRMTVSMGGSKYAKSSKDAAGAAAQSANATAQAALDLAKEEERLQKQIKEANDAKKKSLQDQLELGKAQVQVKQAELDVLKEQIQIQKGGARALGGMDESKRQDLVEAAKTLQKEGIGGLSDDEKDLLRQDPRTAKLLEKQQEKEGLASPENAQINALYEAGGFSGKGLEEAKAEAQKLQEEIIKQNAELNKTFKEAMAQTISDQLKQLTDAVAQAMKSAIEAAIKDMEGKKFVEKNTTSQ